MARSLCRVIIFLFLSAFVLAGCATVLPPEYEPDGGEPAIPGPILALAGDDSLIVAANTDGIYRKTRGGKFNRLEVPGITDFGRVTALAVNAGEICIGTDGEGLFLYKDGTWEVRTVRYGGLPDDGVLSLAYDDDGEGLPGNNLWVGTREGIALRKDSHWSLYIPEKNWLEEMSGEMQGRTDKTYVGSGYDLSGKGEDSKYFKPPVTAIGVGPDRVVFGNPMSRIAMVTPTSAAVVYFKADAEIMSLRVEGGVIWAGTNGGLLWGGLEGVAKGTPWPPLRADAAWSGRLIGTRNSEPFQYRWHLVGYNMARVPSLSLSGESLWVVYGKPDGRTTPILTGGNEENIALNPDVRRFVSIKDYIARKEALAFERYNKNVGIKGFPTTVLPLKGRGELWIGTSKGLYHFEK